MELLLLNSECMNSFHRSSIDKNILVIEEDYRDLGHNETPMTNALQGMILYFWSALAMKRSENP